MTSGMASVRTCLATAMLMFSVKRIMYLSMRRMAAVAERLVSTVVWRLLRANEQVCTAVYNYGMAWLLDSILAMLAVAYRCLRLCCTVVLVAGR